MNCINSNKIDNSTQVAIRIRPGGCLINNTEDTIIYGGNYIKINDSRIILERQFDKVFGPSAVQEEVYPSIG